MQPLPLSWEVLIYLQGILLDTPPGIALISSTGAPSWFFLRTFSSLMAVPWLDVLSGPALMYRLFWCHCKTGDKGSWSEGTPEWNGTSAVIQYNFSAHQGALILCADLSRNGELSTSTHSESGWLPERTIVETHYRSLVSNKHRLPVPPRRSWLVGLKAHPQTPSSSPSPTARPHCRGEDRSWLWELSAGSQQSLSFTLVAKCLKLICLKRSSYGFVFDCC